MTEDVNEQTMMLLEAQQTPQQRAYFDGWFDGTQWLRVLILEHRRMQTNLPEYMIHDKGMMAAEKHIVELRGKRLRDILAKYPSKVPA